MNVWVIKVFRMFKNFVTTVQPNVIPTLQILNTHSYLTVLIFQSLTDKPYSF